jgi:very-short-patch-repair endonuclease
MKVSGPMSWEDVWKSHLKLTDSRNRTLLHFAEKMTPIESIAFVVLHELTLWYGVNHMSLMPQKQIGKYRVDFELVYHPLHDKDPLNMIVVECDGHDFHEKTKEQVAKGKERDRFLIKEGYTVLHYSGSEIVNDRFKIYRDIEELILPENKKYDFGYGKEFEEEMRRLYG